MNEEWRAVSEGYEVSSFGRVRSLDRTEMMKNGVSRRYRGKLLKPSVVASTKTFPGYLAVNVDGRKRYVHHLVAEAFLGPRPDSAEVRHYDNDSHNNCLGNLLYGTAVQNVADSVRDRRLWQQKKDECPRGHQLQEPNLVPSQSSRGWRQCLACQRASNRVRDDASLDLKAVSDAIYGDLMAKVVLTL